MTKPSNLRHDNVITATPLAVLASEMLSGVASLFALVHVTMVWRATRGQPGYRFPCGPQDCAEAKCWKLKSSWPLLNHPNSMPIYPRRQTGVTVCDRKGRTILQQRRNSTRAVNFSRSWQEYEDGFGDDTNHWLGLKHIHRLSTRGQNMLIVTIRNSNSTQSLTFRYDNFWVDTPHDYYKLHLGHPLDNPDIFEWSRQRQFVTPDKRSDSNRECLDRFRSGWWYGNCTGTRAAMINLNGRHSANDDTRIFAKTFDVEQCSMVMRTTKVAGKTPTCGKTCPNGGTCRLAADSKSYYCNCSPGYFGVRCESKTTHKPTTTSPKTMTTYVEIVFTTEGPVSTTDTAVSGWFDGNVALVAGVSAIVAMLIAITVGIFIHRRRQQHKSSRRSSESRSSKPSRHSSEHKPPKPSRKNSEPTSSVLKHEPVIHKTTKKDIHEKPDRRRSEAASSKPGLSKSDERQNKKSKLRKQSIKHTDTASHTGSIADSHTGSYPGSYAASRKSSFARRPSEKKGQLGKKTT